MLCDNSVFYGNGMEHIVHKKKIVNLLSSCSSFTFRLETVVCETVLYEIILHIEYNFMTLMIL